MVYDHHYHSSVANHPELVLRSFLVSSFGKTYHVTGWKVGFVAAPENMTEEFRKVHQFNVFTVNTPMQYGLTKFIEEPKHYLNLSSFYQKKRDLFRDGLSSTKLQLLPNQGTYFQCADYSKITTAPTQLSELEFCRWLTIEKGVAAIPLSAFYCNQIESGVIRFCFAKQDSTLNEAISRLQSL
jgi:methionine aminotransferase